MPRIKLLSESDLRRCVCLDTGSVNCVEDCYRALASGGVVMPPILRLDIEQNNGEVDVKTAYLPGLDSFAIKISPGFFDNPALGLPSVNGLMVVFSTRTGLLKAALLDNGYLTDVRTAAAGAVAARYLSRENATHAAIIGAGVQARLQLEALFLVRPVRSARVWARDPRKAEDFAGQASADLGIKVSAVTQIADAVDGADIVVTTTPSTEPLLRAVHLTPGMHVTAMGSDAEHKNEIHPDVIGACDLYVCDRLAQVRLLGELHHAIDAGLVAGDTGFTELGEVISGARPGRTGEHQVTVCDLTGTGAQDTAIAALALERALANELGVDFDT